MRAFAAVAFAALCLVQGNHGTPLFNLPNPFAGASVDAAAGASARPSLPFGRSLSLPNVPTTPTPKEALVMIEKALNQASGITVLLEATIKGLEKGVDSVVDFALKPFVQVWKEGADDVVAKALDNNVDISRCELNGVPQIISDAPKEAARCATDRLTEANELLKRLLNVPKEAAAISTELETGMSTCSAKALFQRPQCRAVAVTPPLVKTAFLGVDTAKIVAEATALVGTLKATVISCATGVGTGLGTKVAIETSQMATCLGVSVVGSALPGLSSGVPALSSGLSSLSSGLPALSSGVPALSSRVPALSSGSASLSSRVPALNSVLPLPIKV